MFDPAYPAAQVMQALQFNALAIAEMNRVSQPYLQLNRAHAVIEPANADPLIETSRLDPIQISRVLLSAESMIASVIGLKTCEVRISVNTGRYEF